MRRAPCLLLLLLALPLASAVAEEGPEVEPPTRPVRLVAATWNVWLIPVVADDYATRKARIPGALRALDLDLLALQEVWLEADRDALAEACRRDFPHAAQGGGGLMILSRHPIERSAFVPFPAYPGLPLQEKIARKGLLEAVVRTPGGPVRFVTAHLALAFGPDNPKSRQLRFLLDRLAADTTLPTVVAADLNVPPVTAGGALAADYRVLLAAGWTDAKPPRLVAEGRYDPGPPTRIGWPRPERRPTTGFWPDHVLFRSSAAGTLEVRATRLALEQRATALSDHNLVRTEFRLRPPEIRRKKAP